MSVFAGKPPPSMVTTVPSTRPSCGVTLKVAAAAPTGGAARTAAVAPTSAATTMAQSDRVMSHPPLWCHVQSTTVRAAAQWCLRSVVGGLDVPAAAFEREEVGSAITGDHLQTRAATVTLRVPPPFVGRPGAGPGRDAMGADAGHHHVGPGRDVAPAAHPDRPTGCVEQVDGDPLGVHERRGGCR